MFKNLASLAALCALAISSLAQALPEDKQVHGENGWYIPQLNDSLKWVDLLEVENDEQVLLLDGKFCCDFYLYTQENPDKKQRIYASQKYIDASTYNPRNPTRIVIHGWMNNRHDYINYGVRKSLLKKAAYNYIFVQWSSALEDYISACMAVKGVGKQTAALIDFLVEHYGLNLKTLEIIGHSLGAHVAGFAGKNIKAGKAHKIFGLDPALPLFSFDEPRKRLASTDAEYVETIQTNGGGLGFLQPIGKASFYPNGGMKQPGCWDVPVFSFCTCSHSRAITYYIEAVEMDDFISVKCKSYKKAIEDNCGSPTWRSVRMAADANDYSVAGYYYVPVNSLPPFGTLK